MTPTVQTGLVLVGIVLLIQFFHSFGPRETFLALMVIVGLALVGLGFDWRGPPAFPAGMLAGAGAGLSVLGLVGLFRMRGPR